MCGVLGHTSDINITVNTGVLSMLGHTYDINIIITTDVCSVLGHVECVGPYI